MRLRTLFAATAIVAVSAACSNEPGGPSAPFAPGTVTLSAVELIDFNGIAAGTTDPAVAFTGGTLTTSADGAGTCEDFSNIFDTDNPPAPGGEDEDLANQSDQDEILVIQDDDKVAPDDCTEGGTLTLVLSVPVTANSIKILDIDDDVAGDNIELFDAANTSLGTFAIPQTLNEALGPGGNGGIATVSLGNTANVSKIVVTFQTSGGIDDLQITTEEETGDGGCTPGFWKNNLTRWPAGADPSDDFDTTFGVDFFNPDLTLLEALKQGGGGIKALGRHATAAYLNALSGFYPLTAAEVIAAVQAVDSGDKDAVEDLKDELEDDNELGCPVPGDGNADK